MPNGICNTIDRPRRRAVWRLAGDLRGEGAKVFSRLWDAIGWPEDRSVPKGTNALRGRYGGYQVQFVPNLVEDILSLCLSHHDDLQSMAVSTLHSMIVSEVSCLLSHHCEQTMTPSLVLSERRLRRDRRTSDRPPRQAVHEPNERRRPISRVLHRPASSTLRRGGNR